ncbi:Lsa family ABC-F type ribosomal protection protein [Companilactobacillus sp. RD055328]|uniref:ribosomal protection-like ABC-F family protein n=1 Tax=Companilactobacillus sp. RD055328 TaxID=2916634 RepID=UPI001FC7EE36|nr:ABC-F type ribosomal protection protein [Companilactobacillus sp. RD055328]GKQ42303.1 Lsa family ABC-F type ribosomal protection protein [Companilactobacillus sp. RD055328]
MGTIQIQNLSFKYANMSENLFDNINLRIDESWKLGLIGRNGRGKTTLLNIIQNKLSYDGQIITNLDFSYFPKNITNPNQSTQDVVLQIAKLEEYDLWKIQTEMSKLELADSLLGLPYKKLSPGQQTKIQLAAMFVDDHDFQLLDEPTNHLDIKGRKAVESYLNSKQGFIVISHDRHFLNHVIDHVISINRNNITVIHGNFDTWEQEKQNRDQLEFNQKEKLKSDIKKLKSSAAKKENWSQQKEKDKYKKPGMEHDNIDRGFVGSRAARVMKRAKQIQGRANTAIEDKQSLLKNVEISDSLKMNYLEILHSKEVLIVDDLSVGFSDTILNKPISFTLHPNEIISLIGDNGAGKTTFLKKILKQTTAINTGYFKMNSKHKIAYLSQDANELSGTINQLCEQMEISEEEVFSSLRKLGFECELFNSKIETMSQGQKKKVALAINLVQPANLYIWDEPLNYLDVITREQIIDVIKRYQPSMIVIEHDRDFIEQVADKKVNFESINNIEK